MGSDSFLLGLLAVFGFAVLLGPLGVGDAFARGDLTDPGAMCCFSEINRDAEFTGGDGEAVDVVLMLVGDEDGIERGGIFADLLHAAEEFAAAQACIHEDARLAAGRREAGNDGAVSLGTGGEDGETDHLSRIAPIDVEDGVGIEGIFPN